jgi:hypothetical protein
VFVAWFFCWWRLFWPDRSAGWQFIGPGVHDFSLTMNGSFSGFEPIALGCLLYLASKYARDYLPQSVGGMVGSLYLG